MRWKHIVRVHIQQRGLSEAKIANMNVSSAPSAARANCGSSDTPDKSASPEGCQKQSIKAYFPREPGIANALPRLTDSYQSTAAPATVSSRQTAA